MSPRFGARRLGVVLALTAAACSAGADGPSRVVAENEIAARTLMTLWGAADPRTVTGLFHPDAVYDDYANQAQYRGLEEIASYLTGAYDWATALDVAVLAVHASEMGATVEWVLSGIQDHPIGTRVPVASGREVVLNGVTVLEMDRGRIRRAADYTDALAPALQIGGELHLPGGSVLKLDLPPLRSGTDDDQRHIP